MFKRDCQKEGEVESVYVCAYIQFKEKLFPGINVYTVVSKLSHGDTIMS